MFESLFNVFSLPRNGYENAPPNDQYGLQNYIAQKNMHWLDDAEWMLIVSVRARKQKEYEDDVWFSKNMAL